MSLISKHHKKPDIPLMLMFFLLPELLNDILHKWQEKGPAQCAQNKCYSTYSRCWNVTQKWRSPLWMPWWVFRSWGKWFLTHITETSAPHYVCVDVSSGHLDIWMIFYTHHRKMDVPKEGCTDVPSDQSPFWTIYYTHYSKMAIFYYVHPDAPSGLSYYWMTCYTHYKNMDMPHIECSVGPSQ